MANPLLVDERGLPRPSGGPCDIGAVQIQAPANSVAPSVTPAQPINGQTLTCNPGTWTGDGTLGYAYTWLRDGTAIAHQTGATYGAQAADVAHAISCKVTATSVGYNRVGPPATSTGVTVTAPRPAVSITSPADGASFTEGQVIDAAYTCPDPSNGTGLRSCAGTVANGSPIDTSALGQHQFTVTATDTAGQAAAKSVTYTIVARRAKPVVLSHVKQSHRRWRESGTGPKPPVGTTFSFTLSAKARVTLTFTARGAAKVLFKRVVNGKAGANTVSFKGVIRRRRKLQPGRYKLTLTATGATGGQSKPATLTFTIVS